MAPPVGTLRVGRYFLALLAILAVLYAIVFWPGQRHTPKLGLDLVGGTQVIFTAKTENGSAPTTDSMNQAKDILEERVNGTGVTEATVVIQGTDQLVVSIPGDNATDIKNLGAAAVLNFRGLVAPAVQVTCASASTTPGSGASSGSNSSAPATSPSPSSPAPGGAAANERPLKAPPAPASSASPGAGTPTSANASPTTSPTGTTAAAPPASPSAPAVQPCSANPLQALQRSGVVKTIPTTDTAFKALSQTQQAAISAALANFDCAAAQTEPDLPKSDFVACDTSKQAAYLLGPVIVAGKQIDTAAAVAPNISQGVTGWTVTLSLKSSGQSSWADYTSKHNVGGQAPSEDVTNCGTVTPCADFVAFTLDGLVISSPYNNETINGGQTQITGSFSSSTARDLANQLKYGALPLSFSSDQAQEISATLGSAQLKAGLLAGGIGLILVVIYSLIYYRALGLVTIASLLVSGGLTYGCLVMLATQIGFTLSLAGIAGFIVAVGITADSFVVFFERLKDEVHSGRSVRVAVPRAWVRARRTILSADTVSFLAAAILYYFAAGDVRGFAFTLGLSTILDLVVVFLFTHPMVSLLSRARAFGSARFTGLDALRGSAPPDDTPPPPRRTTRSVEPIAAAEPEQPSRFAGVAVLDRPGARAAEPHESVAKPAPESADAPAEQTEADEPEADEPVADESPAEPSARRRTTPEAGSAAERAAARRARLREQRGNDGGKR